MWGGNHPVGFAYTVNSFSNYLLPTYPVPLFVGLRDSVVDTLAGGV